jgi:hypothetical protein
MSAPANDSEGRTKHMRHSNENGGSQHPNKKVRASNSAGESSTTDKKAVSFLEYVLFSPSKLTANETD